ncbi:hypothetical protein Hanom_Chr05g00393321 [Helianthus anomalus]
MFLLIFRRFPLYLKLTSFVLYVFKSYTCCPLTLTQLNFLSNLAMRNAHEGKIVFSPYSLKIHIKEKKIIYHNKSLLLPQINSISKP